MGLFDKIVRPIKKKKARENFWAKRIKTKEHPSWSDAEIRREAKRAVKDEKVGRKQRLGGKRKSKGFKLF